MTRKIDDSKIERLLELHGSGISSVNAGKAVGVSYQTTLNVWKGHGLRPNFNRARIPYSTIRLVSEFVKSGHSPKEASSAFQISEATARRRTKEYGKAEPLLHGFGSQLKELLRSKENTAKELRTVPLPYNFKERPGRRNLYYSNGILSKNTSNIFTKREPRTRPFKEPYWELLRGLSCTNASQSPSKNLTNVPMHLKPGVIDISGFFPNRKYESRQGVKVR